MNSAEISDDRKIVKDRGIIVVRDSSYLMSADFVAILLGLITQIILTHNLSTETYGIWIIIIVAFGILFLLVLFGIPDVLGRDLPRAGRDSHDLFASYFSIQIISALFLLPLGVILLVHLFFAKK